MACVAGIFWVAAESTAAPRSPEAAPLARSCLRRCAGRRAPLSTRQWCTWRHLCVRSLAGPERVRGAPQVVGATNRLTLLDEALLRPGRFDRTIYMGRPSASNRFKILQARRAAPLAPGVAAPRPGGGRAAPAAAAGGRAPRARSGGERARAAARGWRKRWRREGCQGRGRARQQEAKRNAGATRVVRGRARGPAGACGGQAHQPRGRRGVGRRRGAAPHG